MIREPSILNRPPVNKGEQSLLSGVGRINDGLEELRGLLSGYGAQISSLSEKVDGLAKPPEVEEEEPEDETKEPLGTEEPMSETQVSEETLRSEMVRLGVGPMQAPSDLTPEQQGVYAQVSWKTTARVMAGIVGADRWDIVPDGTKKKVYERAFAAAHKLSVVAALPPSQRIGIVRMK